MRVGIGNRFEFRFGGDGVDASWGEGRRLTRGAADTEEDAKIALSAERHYMSAFSLLPMISPPTGNHLFSSGGYDPTVKLAWSKTLLWKFDVGGNFNVSPLSTPDGPAHHRRRSRFFFGFDGAFRKPTGLFPRNQ